MIINGKKYKSYCYVDPIAYKSGNDFEYWINQCLDYNGNAVVSKNNGKNELNGFPNHTR